MKYDYIFSGLGLSSLLVLNEMMIHHFLASKSVLIIEPDKKTANDRTWCFWEKGSGKFDSILKKKWENAYFTTKENQKIECLNNEYSYKMIESQSFYNAIISKLKRSESINWVSEKVLQFQEKENCVSIQTENNTYETEYLFNSVLEASLLHENQTFPLLQQHFVGWFIKTKTPFFESQSVSFMDFSIPQKNNTRFMYVLPTSSTEALVEYTLFSPHVLKTEEYETAISKYLGEKGILDYEIVLKENGNIPMTVYPFWKKNTKRILNIGTAGGWTKASTGYTFKNSTKQAEKIIPFLSQQNIDFRKFKSTNRFRFYDSLFIDVLYINNALGQKLFSNMFKKVTPEKILRFLDEESTFWEELQIIWACPKIPFLKALGKRILKLD